MTDWRALLPTVCIVGTSYSGSSKIPITVVINSSVSGTDEVQVEATIGPTGVFPGMFNDNTDDIVNEFNTSLSTGSISDIINFFKTNFGTSYYDSMLVKFLVGSRLESLEDLRVVFSKLQAKDNSIDVINFIRFYIGALSFQNNTDVDVTIWNDIRYSLPTDIFSSLLASLNFIQTDVETENGKVSSIYIDLVSCAENIFMLQNDIFCTTSGMLDCNIDVLTASGGFIATYSDLYSTKMEVSGTKTDIRTWSLEFGDFFLDVEEFTTTSATAWVDIVDCLWNINTDDSYFAVDGQRVPVIFSSINNGYRMSYDPIDDFYSKDTLVYTAHIENVVGDSRERDYYLLRGYDVAFSDVVDWGANKEIAVWSRASNLAFCPNSNTAAFYFTIQPVISKDLGATIYPQSTYYFYGRTFKVTVEGVKDFAGNELAPFEYEFIIEDPDN